MKVFEVVLCLSLLLSACAPSPAAPSTDLIQTAIAQTQAAAPTSTEPPAPTETAVLPTRTPAPTNTPRPTNTTAPTATVEPTQAVDMSLLAAKNFVASQDSGGVILEVARVIIGDKNATEVALGQDFDQGEIFHDKQTVVEFIFRVVNNTDQTVTLYADQATVAINGEQVDVWEYTLEGARFGDDLGGDFLPGVTAIGGVWIGLKRTPFQEVSRIQIKVSGPANESFDRLGPDYNFDIEVSDWSWEELPAELQ